MMYADDTVLYEAGTDTTIARVLLLGQAAHQEQNNEEKLTKKMGEKKRKPEGKDAAKISQSLIHQDFVLDPTRASRPGESLKPVKFRSPFTLRTHFEETFPILLRLTHALQAGCTTGYG